MTSRPRPAPSRIRLAWALKNEQNIIYSINGLRYWLWDRPREGEPQSYGLDTVAILNYGLKDLLGL